MGPSSLCPQRTSNSSSFPTNAHEGALSREASAQRWAPLCLPPPCSRGAQEACIPSVWSARPPGRGGVRSLRGPAFPARARSPKRGAAHSSPAMSVHTLTRQILRSQFLNYNSVTSHAVKTHRKYQLSLQVANTQITATPNA